MGNFTGFGQHSTQAGCHHKEKESNDQMGLTLSGRKGGGGGGIKGLDDHTHSCESETSYSMMPKHGDFYFLSLRHVLTKF